MTEKQRELKPLPPRPARPKQPAVLSEPQLIKASGVSRRTIQYLRQQRRITPLANVGTENAPRYIYSADAVQEVLNALGKGAQFMHVTAACRYLEISRQTWYNWIAKHPIPAYEMPGLQWPVYERSDIDAMAKAHGKKPFRPRKTDPDDDRGW